MSKIKSIIYYFYLANILLSTVIGYQTFIFLSKYSKNEVIVFMFATSIFILCTIGFHFIFQKILEKILNNKEDVEFINFQLKEDIIVKPKNGHQVMILKFVSVGIQFDLELKTSLKIGVYKELTLGTVRIKPNKSYRISFFCRKYQNKTDSYSFYREPVSIDHHQLNSWEDFKFKENGKIKPRLYLVR